MLFHTLRIDLCGSSDIICQRGKVICAVLWAKASPKLVARGGQEGQEQTSHL